MEGGASAPTQPPRVVIVEGEIAAGKTELSRALAATLSGRYRTVLVPEPVDEWRDIGILRKFYADPARFGYAFQTYVFSSRIKAIVAAVKSNPGLEVIVLERSPATDPIFMATLGGVIDPIESRMYESWCETYIELLPFDLSTAEVVYLSPSIDTCMERLHSRCRQEEITEDTGASADATVPEGPPGESPSGGVSRPYQERLRRGHRARLLGEPAPDLPSLKRAPFSSVLVVDQALAGLDFREGGAGRDAVVGGILAELGFAL